jgi:UDP-GlcNAc3NAcA epimerase
LEDFRLTPEGYVLSTVHRAENTDDPAKLRNILDALSVVARRVEVVLPLHPRTHNTAESMNITFGEIKVIPPVSYLDMIQLERHSKIIMTDSGGVQKEAYFFKKPCITLREETEWVELVSAGVNILVGADAGKIVDAFHASRATEPNFGEAYYGDGRSAWSILHTLLDSNTRSLRGA